MRILKSLGLLVAAALLALLLFEVGPATLFTFGPLVRENAEWIIVVAGILSLGTPRRYKWINLAGWAFYFGYWTLYETMVLRSGDLKFGPMLLPYGIGAIIFGITAGVSASGKGEKILFGKRSLNPS